jgi:uncharacterized glyoxalase superfamily protein PhnB
VKLAAHATVLLVDDVTRAADYYRDQLGFEVSFYEKNPTHYAYASRDEVYLHFACFKDAPPRPNIEVVPPDMFDFYIYVDDLDALYRELVERGADLILEPTDQGYGLREIRVRDPHGYVLAFGQFAE